MNVIFLDIDGVLNTKYTKDRVVKGGSVTGVEDRYVKNLRKIVDATGCEIVLISSWKVIWGLWKQGSKCKDIEYLNKKLAKQKLKIHDCTEDRGDNRGYGILQYVGHNNVTKWLVLDDEEFEDYRVFGIMNHLVKTDWYIEDGGLTEEKVKEALALWEKM